MARTKKEIELNPTIELKESEIIEQKQENGEVKTPSFVDVFNNMPEVRLKELDQSRLPDMIKGDSENGTDTFFKAIIDNLYSKKNISLKTEYMNEDENFTGAKLEFLTSECGFEMGKQFLPTWEEKRVSLNRKSRQEIIMALWERQKEIQEQERREKFKDEINM